MKWHDYQLADTVSKTTEDVTLWKSKKGNLEIEADTLALPIELNGEGKGFVFRGKGKLLLDAIIETDRGAVGESVEKELTKSFLMLGSPVEVQARLGPANHEDFERLGSRIGKRSSPRQKAYSTSSSAGQPTTVDASTKAGDSFSHSPTKATGLTYSSPKAAGWPTPALTEASFLTETRLLLQAPRE